MNEKIDRTWHLAENVDEIKVTEFEFQLWRVFSAFTRWQEDCYRYVCDDELSANDLAFLHIIRMNNRPKTIYDITRLLHRDDPNNVQYGIRKLTKMDLIEKVKISTSKTVLSYQTTEKGAEQVKLTADWRKNNLIELFKKEGLDKLNLELMTDSMRKVMTIYDEAGKQSASYKK